MRSSVGRPGGAAGAATVTVATALVMPLFALVVLLGAAAGAHVLAVGCGGGGTAATVAAIGLDAEQMANAQTVVTLTASRRLPAYAAVVAVATAYQESKLRNTVLPQDHDSEGLFQLRVSLWGKQVADDPVRSTGWFLDRLVQVANWRSSPLTETAQAVQRSAFPDAYARWQSLAAGVVGQLWPTAAAAAAPVASTSGRSGSSGGTAMPVAAVLCPNSGDGIPASAGAASMTVPAGLSIAGSPAGIEAVRFALAQLAKPYVWGAAGPDAYDCSGLTLAAWAQAGLALPHYTGDQVNLGTPSPTDLSQATAGDLVFIAGSDGTASAPGHVGMIAGFRQQRAGRQLLIVDAPHTGADVQLIDARRWAGLIVAVRHLA